VSPSRGPAVAPGRQGALRRGPRPTPARGLGTSSGGAVPGIPAGPRRERKPSGGERHGSNRRPVRSRSSQAGGHPGRLRRAGGLFLSPQRRDLRGPGPALGRLLQRAQRGLRRRRLRPDPGPVRPLHHLRGGRAVGPLRGGGLLHGAPARLPPGGHAQHADPAGAPPGPPHPGQRGVRPVRQDGPARRLRGRDPDAGERGPRDGAAGGRGPLPPPARLHRHPGGPGRGGGGGLRRPGAALPPERPGDPGRGGGLRGRTARPGGPGGGPGGLPDPPAGADRQGPDLCGRRGPALRHHVHGQDRPGGVRPGLPRHVRRPDHDPGGPGVRGVRRPGPQPGGPLERLQHGRLHGGPQALPDRQGAPAPRPGRPGRLRARGDGGHAGRPGGAGPAEERLRAPSPGARRAPGKAGGPHLPGVPLPPLGGLPAPRRHPGGRDGDRLHGPGLRPDAPRLDLPQPDPLGGHRLGHARGLRRRPGRPPGGGSSWSPARAPIS